MTLRADYNINELLAYAHTIPINNYLRYVVSKDPLRSRFTPEYTNYMLDSSCHTAQQIATELKTQYGQHPAAEYAKLLEVQITTVNDAPDWQFGFAYLSTYTANPPLITLYQAALDIVAQQLDTPDSCLPISADQMREIAIMHELFHHLEQQRPQIATRTKTLVYKAMGIFTHQVAPLSASEVAAVQFSQLMTNSDYSPLIYELIMQFAHNKVVAKELIQTIANCTEKR